MWPKCSADCRAKAKSKNCAADVCQGLSRRPTYELCLIRSASASTCSPLKWAPEWHLLTRRKLTLVDAIAEPRLMSSVNLLSLSPPDALRALLPGGFTEPASRASVVERVAATAQAESGLHPTTALHDNTTGQSYVPASEASRLQRSRPRCKCRDIAWTPASCR